jgi:hypothetical protein
MKVMEIIMQLKMRRMIVGLSLATGLALNGVSALKVSAQQSSPETLNQYAFCKSRLKGENFARTELFFGLSKSDGSVVTEAEFQNFLDTEVTPRFPDGLTLLTGAGQFKDSSGTIAEEESKLLILLYPFSSESNSSVEQIREAYKSAFQQESVLRTDERSCVSF